MSNRKQSTQTTWVRFKLNKSVNDDLKKVQAAIRLKTSEFKTMHTLYDEAITIGTRELKQRLKVA